MTLHRVGKCLGLSILICAICTGCIVPLDLHPSDSRKNIGKGSLPDIIPGVTTREEILLALGEPDRVNFGEEEFIYTSRKLKAIWFIAAGASGAGGNLEKEYILKIAFDENGKVVKSNFVDHYDFTGW